MEEKPLLKWTSHPLVDYPLSSFLVVIVMLMVSILLYRMAFMTWEAPLYFYLGMLFFIGSLITWFIPTTYELYDNKIVIYYAFIKIEKVWSEFHCWYADKKGVLLSTFRQPRRLDSFRGQSLRFSKTKAEKEELYKILSEKAGKEY
jgi:hypothetical protein